MQFSRNRLTKWLLIIAGFLLVIGGGFYLYQARFSASTLVTDGQIDEVSLSDMALAQKPSLPVIQIDYSKAQIETALTNYHNTNLANLNTLSAIDQQIITEITNKEKSLPNTQSDSVAFNIIDKDGNQVNQTVGLNTGAMSVQSVASIARNFDFAADVPQSTKDDLLTEYSKIQNFYGPRSNSSKIKVNENGNGCPYSRGACYFSGMNTISVSHPDLHVETHELIHAFHGPLGMLRPLWEEGMTESATEIILGSQDSTENEYINAGLSGYELNNLPYLNFANTLSAENPDAYAWGSAAMYKLYLENHNFYKEFNAKLYSAAVTNILFTSYDPNLIKIVYQVVPTVEGESSLDWFSHQYPFISTNDSASFDSSNVAGTTYSPKTESLIFWVTNDFSKYKSLDLKVYYADGAMAGECSGNSSDPNFVNSALDQSTINKNYCKNVKFVPDYNGYLKNVVATDGNSSNQRVFYSPVLSSDNENYIAGIVVGKADQAKISNIDNNLNTTVQIKNGIFVVSDKNFQLAGRYKVDILSSGQIVKTHYFNKSGNSSPNIWDTYFVLVDLTTQPKAKITATALNHSIKLQVAANLYSGFVYRVNRVPIVRSWGKSENYTLASLKRNMSYNWFVMLSQNSDFGRQYRGSIKTLSGPDFKLLSSKSFGNPLKSTFYQQFTFNEPYDPKTVAIGLNCFSGDAGSGINTAFKITPVNVNTFNLVPTQQIYNNAVYYVSGLDKIFDLSGNPLYQFNWNLTNFSTPPNPSASPEPVYTLNSSTYHPTDNIIISTNFTSKDLLSKLSKIVLTKETEKGECTNPDDSTCGQVSISVSVVNNKIIIKPDQPLIVGKNYWITMPYLIDDNNNIVVFTREMSDALTFSVN